MNIIIYADSHHGRYIPQYFAESIDREKVTGIDLSLLDDLADPDDEWYWENWENVLNNCIIDGKYNLLHDGDLFLVDWSACTFKECSQLNGNGVFDTLDNQWQEMINNGRIPAMEFELINDEYLLVDIEFTDNGLEFSFDSDNKQCFFDGAIETINDNRYLLPFDEYFDSLDYYLEMISENITEGFICANRMMPL